MPAARLPSSSPAPPPFLLTPVVAAMAQRTERERPTADAMAVSWAEAFDGHQATVLHPIEYDYGYAALPGVAYALLVCDACLPAA